MAPAITAALGGFVDIVIGGNSVKLQVDAERALCARIVPRITLAGQ